MAYRIESRSDFTANDHGRFSRKAFSRTVVGGVAIICVTLACAWTLSLRLAATRGDAIAMVRTVPAGLQAMPPMSPNESAAPDAPAAPVDPDLYAALFDPAYSDLRRDTFSAIAPREADLRTAKLAAPFAKFSTGVTIAAAPAPANRLAGGVIPVPPTRPSEFKTASNRNPSLHAMAQRNKINPADEQQPSLFQKLFGANQEPGTRLAYAAPDGGVLGDGQSITPGRLPSPDQLTAVYDISARTVYMPDGTKLEAHSGLGSRLDDPRFVHERMRGATPPHVYRLSLRERLFHGVRALRLTPVGDGHIFGRTGLLAHTYMLGANGDSNGCVSFKDYNAFLQAYLNGKVERLVVVARRG